MSSAPVEDVPPIQPYDLFRRAGPIPEMRLEGLVRSLAPSLVARSPQTSTSSSDSQITSCGPNDTTGPCERGYGASSTSKLPIILGVVIPVTITIVTLIYLHRRHVKKLRREDLEDPHKSLDFGVSGSEKRKKTGRKGAVPEMSVNEAIGAVRHDRGVSLDLTATNPYILPPEVQQSRESLHSLSRKMNTGDDKYRATTFIPDDGSMRSPSSLKSHWDDNSSNRSMSSRRRTDTESTKGLLPLYPTMSSEPVPSLRKPLPVAKDNGPLLAPVLQDPARDSYLSTTSSNGAVAALRASNNYLGAYISGGNGIKQDGQAKPNGATTTVMELEGSSPQEPPAAVMKDGMNKRRSEIPNPTADFDFNISNAQELPAHEAVVYHEMSADRNSNLPQFNVTSADALPTQKRESSVYEDYFDEFPKPATTAPIHHLTTHELPSEKENVPVQDHHYPQIEQQQQQSSPEVRQQPPPEIRQQPPPEVRQQPRQRESEYTEDSYDINEYKDVLGYDPRLLTMGQRPLPPDDPSENPEERAIKIRSFYKEYFEDSAKPSTNRVSYYDGSENYIDDYYGTAASSPYGSRGPSRTGGPQTRHRATVSNGTYHGPRAYSSASGRMGTRRPMPMPKKKLPPPAPLLVLPTPSKLQEDSMLPNAIDFAPPQVFKNQRSGTPDSLRGGSRAYSPSTRAYNPLVSSFDDLAVLPSPHQLRKSSTFTSLDFAPPRFAAAEANASETGSIRSNRSGVSAIHQQNIRAGAYRVSRIPREVAGTKVELSTALRPQWDMNR